MTRQGKYGPLLVEENKLQGFVVRACENIKARTLLCEYVGQVDFARNHIFDNNDSIMDLLRTSRSKTSLVIIPEQKGNIARFISGINNCQKGGQNKQNVQSIRINIDGQVKVILFAKRNIKKGELLYYDYNAGGFNDYPTEQFV
ncbi:SET domain protein [Ichthyophthirius multifiliis]|uniref:SET domain protein n=1 Tax=Ichthyophthirius multifiliis TaxID=5932 RepID=G0QYD3_ICHMU|nr:SET domain protein [Ichthyophthirius multifiliis]EGR29796.1 SET domain protein [Ichthyophthirius multifiliis]|eukprot:XP_004031032.1 SET domain protein [Ichthyophthirius multifiliis]